MASLTKRKNKWYITWKVGRRVERQSTGYDIADEAKARIALAKFEEDRQLERIDPTARYRRTTIEQHIDDYIEWKKSRGDTKKHVFEVNNILRRAVTTLKLTKVNDITAEIIDRYVGRMPSYRNEHAKNRKEGEKPSPRTRNITRKTFKAFCRWLYENSRASRHHLVGLRMENEEVDIRKKRDRYTDQEIRKLYQTALDDGESTVEGMIGSERAMLYLFAVASGLRRAELASITPASFDWSAGSIVILASFSKRRRKDVVFVPEWALLKIREYIATLPDVGGQLIFPSLGRRNTSKIIQHDLKRAGIPRVVNGATRDFHCLRHTYITRLWVDGGDPRVIQQLARHSDIKTTMGYSHTSQKELRAATSKIKSIKFA